jgi:hypothetical protein
MIGRIESYDNELKTGAIKAEDKVYEFHIDEWNPDIAPSIGNNVDFMPEEDGSATSIDMAKAYLKDSRAVKNHYLAGFLGVFFGALGLHRIYLGFYPRDYLLDKP